MIESHPKALVGLGELQVDLSEIRRTLMLNVEIGESTSKEDPFILRFEPKLRHFFDVVKQSIILLELFATRIDRAMKRFIAVQQQQPILDQTKNLLGVDHQIRFFAHLRRAFFRHDRFRRCSIRRRTSRPNLSISTQSLSIRRGDSLRH